MTGFRGCPVFAWVQIGLALVQKGQPPIFHFAKRTTTDFVSCLQNEKRIMALFAFCKGCFHFAKRTTTRFSFCKKGNDGVCKVFAKCKKDNGGLFLQFPKRSTKKTRRITPRLLFFVCSPNHTWGIIPSVVHPLPRALVPCRTLPAFPLVALGSVRSRAD